MSTNTPSDEAAQAPVAKNTDGTLQAFPVSYGFTDAETADLLGCDANPLDQYSDLKVWVGWAAEMRNERPTKIPKSPEAGWNASSDSPATWDTRAAAERLTQRKQLPGVGIMLGDTLGNPDWRLSGVDLDSCFDSQGDLLPWAAEVLERFNTYAEISPSGNGIKLFFRVTAADADTLIERHDKAGFQFSRGDHTEMVLYLGKRWFTVTGKHFPAALTTLSVIDSDALNWFINEAGPAFKESMPAGKVDRSAKLQAIAHDQVRAGTTYEAFKAAAMADPHAAGHVRDQGNERAQERALKRAWDRATEESARLVDSFEDVPELLTPQPKSYEATESGIGLEFVAQHGDRYRFDHDRGRWYVWNGATWGLDATRSAENRIEDIARRKAAVATKDAEKRGLLRNSTTNGATAMASRNPAVAVTQKVWDADPWLLGTPRGTVNLRTGEIRTPDPADLITKQAGATPIALCEFGSGQLCPRWLAFLHDATAGDAGVIRYLQQWAGYMLTGDVRAEELLFIHGPGGGGKSTFLNTLAETLGDYAISVPSDTLTLKRHEDHKTELARLHGARLAYCSELPEGARWHENRIKELTGGDTIDARFMRQDYFEFKPQLKLVIVGNNAPSLSNVDKAIRRRFNVVAFDNPPASKDETLKAKLREELPAILSWAIEGALDWQRNGFTKPYAVKRATADYLDAQDHFSQWLEEYCERDPVAVTATVDLYDSWRSFARWESIEPGSLTTTFPVKLRDCGFAAAKNVVRASDGRRLRGWTGLRLIRPDDDLLS